MAKIQFGKYQKFKKIQILIPKHRWKSKSENYNTNKKPKYLFCADKVRLRHNILNPAGIIFFMATLLLVVCNVKVVDHLIKVKVIIKIWFV